MSISSAFIARPIATSLVMAGILLVGAAAYPLLPVAPLPQVDFPTRGSKGESRSGRSHTRPRPTWRIELPPSRQRRAALR